MLLENQHTEFKSSFNDAVIETVSAFVNTKGGKVYIGVDDLGQPIPNFSIGKESIQNLINEIKNKTQPGIIADIEPLIIQGKEIICVSVHEFPVKPVAFKGRYYQRVNGANHQLSSQEVADLHLKTYSSSWDYYPSPHYDMDSIPIGDGSIIGSTSEVSKDIPAFSIAVGSPAKVIKTYDQDSNKWVNINNK